MSLQKSIQTPRVLPAYGVNIRGMQDLNRSDALCHEEDIFYQGVDAREVNRFSWNYEPEELRCANQALIEDRLDRENESKLKYFTLLNSQGVSGVNHPYNYGGYGTETQKGYSTLTGKTVGMTRFFDQHAHLQVPNVNYSAFNAFYQSQSALNRALRTVYENQRFHDGGMH